MAKTYAATGWVRQLLPAPLGFSFCLCFVIVHGEPLQVYWIVKPKAFQWVNVIYLPSRAGQAVQPSGGASLLVDELTESFFTPSIFGVCASGHCADEHYENRKIP
jgi:hypothetical protein